MISLWIELADTAFVVITVAVQAIDHDGITFSARRGVP
jgi:hypothetical protein